MTPWTKKQKMVALTFGSIVIIIAVTAPFLGFIGFKSVNVIAAMLIASGIGFCVTAVAWVAGKVSKHPRWPKVYKTGWLLTAGPLLYVAFELMNPVL